MSLKIMVVDDEPKSAQLMRAVATPLGHSVLPFRETIRRLPRIKQKHSLSTWPSWGCVSTWTQRTGVFPPDQKHPG